MAASTQEGAPGAHPFGGWHKDNGRWRWARGCALLSGGLMGLWGPSKVCPMP